VLFIAAGAFHMSKPSDLIPELQGRFPIRVELDPGQGRLRAHPDGAAERVDQQQVALLATEEITLHFATDSIDEIAATGSERDERTEIGARRLHTIIEKLLDEISFDAPEKKGAKITSTQSTSGKNSRRS